MENKVLILHGWGGSDSPHWQSWLAGELAKDYGKVSFLKFSDFEYPDEILWRKELLDELDDFKPTIVICHSLANTVWFHLCNEKKLQEVERLYLVTPPSLRSNIDELKGFFPQEIPTNLYAKDVTLVCSTDDPYMEMQEAYSLQKTINSKIKVLQNAGHINADSGYGAWQWMLDEVKSSFKD